MCVVCRGRFEQHTMLRLQCKDKQIVPFSGMGRSFYICNNCINDKKLDKIIQKICKVDKTQAKELIKTLKEIEFYE